MRQGRRAGRHHESLNIPSLKAKHHPYSQRHKREVSKLIKSNRIRLTTRRHEFMNNRSRTGASQPPNNSYWDPWWEYPHRYPQICIVFVRNQALDKGSLSWVVVLRGCVVVKQEVSLQLENFLRNLFKSFIALTSRWRSRYVCTQPST